MTKPSAADLAAAEIYIQHLQRVIQAARQLGIPRVNTFVGRDAMKSVDANWTGLFEPGERVRLRLVNAAAMSFFDVRIPGLTMTVVQADGQDVEPVRVDEIRMGVAETYDVIVEPQAGDLVAAEPIACKGIGCQGA